MCTPTPGVWQPAGCVSCELVCVCAVVGVVRVVIICLASTHTSPSPAVLHLSTYLPTTCVLGMLLANQDTELTCVMPAAPPAAARARRRRPPPPAAVAASALHPAGARPASGVRRHTAYTYWSTPQARIPARGLRTTLPALCGPRPAARRRAPIDARRPRAADGDRPRDRPRDRTTCDMPHACASHISTCHQTTSTHSPMLATLCSTAAHSSPSAGVPAGVSIR